MTKKDINKGTAIWIDEIGAIRPRVFDVLKDDKEKKELIIGFGNNEVYKISKSNIRAKRTIIYQKANGEIVSQNPDKLSNLDLKKKGIKTLRFNLQNSSLQESRAAIHRWAPTRDIVDKLGPIFKLMFICIAVGVIGWAAFKFGGDVLNTITRSRLLDCSTLIPNAPVPIGVDMTTPVGT